MMNGYKKNSPVTYEIVNSDEYHWQMSIPEKFVFTDLLHQIRPTVAIEVGTRYGGSIRVISMFSEMVFSLDIDPQVQEHINSFNNVTFIKGDSGFTLPTLLSQMSKDNIALEFVLIDGDHSFNGVRRDIESLLCYTPVNPVTILLHDSYNPNCREGIRSIDWSCSPYVHYMELDYVPGLLLNSQKHYNQMWGGLALGMMYPFPRKGILEIQARAELSFQASYNCSIHKTEL